MASSRVSITSSRPRSWPGPTLGIRTAWRTELDCSPAELVYGTLLTVPGLLVGDQPQVQDQELLSSEFVQDLLSRMDQLKPTEMVHHAVPKIQIPPSIAEADLVYVRTDAVRQPLVRPYTGPYRVIGKSAKYFTVLKSGRPDNISLDRLKPAFLFENNNIESELGKRTVKVTQPQFDGPNSETEKVPLGTTEVAPKSYKEALCGDRASFSGNGEGFSKRTYVKRKPEARQEPATLRSGRISRPPVLL